MDIACNGMEFEFNGVMYRLPPVVESSNPVVPLQPRNPELEARLAADIRKHGNLRWNLLRGPVCLHNPEAT